MRTIRTATEAEVLDCFWTAELSGGSRWSEAEVESRQDAWREREGLFLGLPHDVEWERRDATRTIVQSRQPPRRIPS